MNRENFELESLAKILLRENFSNYGIAILHTDCTGHDRAESLQAKFFLAGPIQNCFLRACVAVRTTIVCGDGQQKK